MPPKPKKETPPPDDTEDETDDTEETDDDSETMLDKLADKIAKKLIDSATPPKRTAPKKSGVLNFLDSLADR